MNQRDESPRKTGAMNVIVAGRETDILRSHEEKL